VHRSILAGFFLVSLLMVARAAQSPSDADTPMWTMEVLKVQPGMFGATLGYLAGCGKIVLSQQFLGRCESCGGFRASEA